MFFAFDGIDGAGKSTQLERFVGWLRGEGRHVITCRDPGSTPLGEALRTILLDKGDLAIHARSEMLIYMAARVQLVEEVIRPALAAGSIVVCDRFLLSNVVYQGYAGGESPELIWQIGSICLDRVEPDLTFLLDLPVEVSLARVNRPFDRMESKGSEFLTRVRNGFLSEAANPERRIAVVDATQSIDEVERQIRRQALQRLGAAHKETRQG